MNTSIDILFIDEHMVAVDKPPGVLVHPNAWHPHNQPTMLSMVEIPFGNTFTPFIDSIEQHLAFYCSHYLGNRLAN